MERVHQLTELAGLIAAVRAQQRVVRLVLRNTDRFGLIHLYFARGQLFDVEGHAGSPTASLSDLATWRHGAIRVDAIDTLPPGAANVADLEAALRRALTEMEARGAIYAAPPARPPREYQSASALPPGIAAAGLPPLAPVGQPASDGFARSQPNALTLTPHGDRLTDPQWQLLTIAVRQVTELAGQALGDQVAEGLLRQALAQSTLINAFLTGVEVDETGWLRAREAGYPARFATFDAAEATATLLTSFEALCAQLLGTRRAQQLVATAVAPLRPSLAQIGIAIATE
jgi:hypothetical protein